MEMIKLLLPLCKGCKDVRNKFGKKPADLLNSSDIKKVIRQSTSRKRDDCRSKSKEKAHNNHNIQIHKVNDEGSGMQ